MVIPSVSAIKDLNAAIQGCNPFTLPATVCDRNLGGQEFPDLEALNAHASAPVVQALEQARNSQVLVASFAIAAPPGFGKSHLIGRLCNFGKPGRALFSIYANAQKLSDLNLIRYQFLQTLVDSLRRRGSQGRMQWQELATLMASQAVQALKPTTKPFVVRELVKKLDDSSLQTNKTWINQLTDAFLKLKPTIREPDVVRAIFWTLSNAQAPFALKWIAGRVLSPWKADELGLPNRSREDREAEAFETVLQVLSLIAQYRPLLICFDQLEAPEVNESNFKRERVVASLVKYLFDRLSAIALDRGIVFLTAMRPETWTDIIRTLPAGIPDRVAGKGKDPIALEGPLESDRILELVTFRLEAFYRDRNLTPPHPVYPFDPAQLHALGRENLSGRDILEWCAENFQPVEVDPLEQVERVLQTEFAKVPQDILDNSTLLANILCFSFERLIGKTVDGVTIVAVERTVQPKAANKGYIQFRLIGSANTTELKIGIAILQSRQPKTISAGLKRLIQFNTFNLTSGCLLRTKSPNQTIPAHWQAYQTLNQLIDQGGKWLDLKPEDLQPLISLWFVYQNRDIYELNETHIFEFIVQRQLITTNTLIQQILHSAADSTPATLTDILSGPNNDSPSSNDSVNEAGLSINPLDSRVH